MIAATAITIILATPTTVTATTAAAITIAAVTAADKSGILPVVIFPPPKAVIFDIDGTLVDNMALHAEAFAVFAARHGLPPLTPEDRARLDGRRNSEIFPILFGREVRARGVAGLRGREGRPLSGVVARPAGAHEGPAAAAGPLPGSAMPMALATSAPEPNVVHTLREIGLADAFSIIVRGDQVGAASRRPTSSSTPAAGSAVAPGACLVFEDAPMGVVAAQAAGMPVVALTTSFSAAHFAGPAAPAVGHLR